MDQTVPATALQTVAEMMPDEVPLAPSLGIEAIEDLAEAEFELLQPITEQGTGLFLTLAGPEHPDRKKISMSIQRAARAALAKKMAATGRAEPDFKDPEEDAAEQLENLIRATLGWRRKDGKPCTPFSQQAVRDLYSNPKYQWVTRQVMRRMYDLELFIKA